MVDGIGLAVHQLPRAHDLASRRLPNRLMPQADAQDRQTTQKALNASDRDPRFLRRARARRDDQVAGLQDLDLVQRDPVVAVDLDIHGRVDLAQTLHEVVGERIVVVDDQDHDDAASGQPGCRILPIRERAYLNRFSVTR